MRISRLFEFRCGNSQRLEHQVEHLLRIVRLFNEVEAALLHGLDSHWYVAIGCHEDHWRSEAPIDDLIKHVETAHRRHADIQHDARRSVIVECVQKLCAIREAGALKLDTAQKTPKRGKEDRKNVGTGKSGSVSVDD